MVDVLRTTLRSLTIMSITALLILSLLISPAVAQSPSVPSAAPTPSPSPVISLSTGVTTITTTTRGRASVILSTFVLTTTLPPSSTSTKPSASLNSTVPSPTPEPIHLDTRVTPTFAVLGALLILTGLPSAFWGHKNRWTSFFLVGFYTLSLVCLVLIIRFGVITEIKPPSKTLQGLFLLSCCVAGIAGGGIAIFFWKGAKYVIGGWGGFAFALWVQCFHNGGLIKPIAPRWIFFVACGVIGFILCSIPKLHYHTLLLSTALVGATSIVLGADCFTTAGLKEFYMFNLGFKDLFPKFYPPPKSPQYPNPGTITTPFPVSQNMQVELGIIAAITAMGVAVQFRIYVVLLQKLREITHEEEIRRAEAEMEAASRFKAVDDDLEDWEKRHGNARGAPEASRSDSAAPLIGGAESLFSTAASDPRKNPSARFGNLGIGFGESKVSQGLGPLPALDLGGAMRTELPTNFVASSDDHKGPSGSEKGSNDQSSEILLAEVRAVRRELTELRSGSNSSHHTPALDNPNVRQGVNRERVKSFSGLTTYSISSRSEGHALDGPSNSRPNSTPLKEEDWDAYVRERKLFVPPSGVTPPVATHTPSPTRSRHSSMHMDVIPEAVADALKQRKEKEKLWEQGGPGRYAAEAPEVLSDPPVQPKRRSLLGRKEKASSGDEVTTRRGHLRAKSADTSTALHAPQPRHEPRPVSILPPASPPRPTRGTSPNRAASPYTPEPRTYTFEELSSRHREKMRAMQRPLSNQEQEQVKLDAAKDRWARANKNEKEVMAKRHAEARASVDSKKDNKRQSGMNEFGERSGHRSGGEGSRNRPDRGQPPSRSRSTDMHGAPAAAAAAAPPAAVVPQSSTQRRSSAMKVQEWQKYQQRSMSSPEPDEDVPFPSGSKKTRRSSRQLGGKQYPN